MSLNIKTTLALLSTIALFSCTLETPETPTDNSGDFESVVIRAHNFDWAENAPTKTTLTVSETDGAVFSWAAGDIVGIYPDVGTQVRFPILEGLGQNTQVAKFTGGGWAVKGAHKYMAYYPFIPDMDLDKEAIPVDYTGQIQDGNANTSHLSPFDFMAAAGSAPSDGEISFDFEHLGALLMLNLTVPKVGEYTTLTLTSNNVPFVTKGTVNITADEPTITPTDWSNEFVIHLNNLTTTQANENVVIYALIPPVDLSGQTITVNLRGDHADCETSFTRGNNKPFLAGKSYRPTMGAMVGGDVIKLENGAQFNEDIKTLVNGEHFIYDKTDYRIKSVSFEVGDDEVPTEYARVDVSAPDSPSPIYAYWKSEEGELVIRTPSNKVYANQDAGGMFNRLDKLTHVDFTGFDLTYCSSVDRMFFTCRSLESIDISNWNTANVETFGGLFEQCSSLKNIKMDGLDLSSATSFSFMFSGCGALEEVDLSDFYTPALSNINFMFYYSPSIKNIIFGERFNTSNITEFIGTFEGCNSLESLDLSMFDLSNVTSYARLFSMCYNLTEITGDFTIRRGNEVSQMFNDCHSLRNIDVSSWDVSETEDLSNVFSGCNSLESLDVSEWKVSNVKHFGSLFSGCSSLTELNLSTWNTSAAEDMSYMFANCNSLTSLDLNSFVTNGVSNFTGMFQDCSALQSLDVSNFNTDNATEFNSMFRGCSSLTSLDVSNFNTSGATSLEQMFGWCSNLVTLDIHSFDISHVISLREFFSGCTSLKNVNYGTFDTHYCEDFTDMYRGCAGFENLDLSFFDTSSATGMENMFYGCENIALLDLSSFDVSHVGTMGAFIRDCFHLSQIRLNSGFLLAGPWYFATDLARDIENCTIYCSQDFKNAWESTDGVYGPDSSKLIWINCDTNEPLE
ncbi:MAG: BspA family leucine-rich repeat surface protein [Bacteroidales bacterium]|nr:BspA family leucine-rich repeat surface protein [Bacteroidales bacterium]